MSTINFKQVLEKAERFCAYSERCRIDVVQKLKKLKVPQNDHQKILQELEKNGFLDEARYAQFFSRDKFNLNGWGKIKISIALRQKKIPEKYIVEALNAFDEEEYFEKLKTMMERKAAQLNEEDEFTFQNKLAKFFVSRGFEIDLVWKIVQDLKK